MTPSDTDRLPQVIALRASLVDLGKTLTRLIYEAGGAIGTGTDLSAGGLVPGFSLHLEVALLVDAGLPEHAAIWASVRGPGERAGGDPLTGRVEVGAPADLVLLRENPFEQIQALSSIEAVIVGGRMLDRKRARPNAEPDGGRLIRQNSRRSSGRRASMNHAPWLLPLARPPRAEDRAQLGSNAPQFLCRARRRLREETDPDRDQETRREPRQHLV